MSEQPMDADTAKVIVVVKMADDLHHALGRIAGGCWWIAAFFALALVIDLWDREWLSAAFMAAGVVGFGLQGRDTWKRRSKYAEFVRSNR